MKIKKVKLGIRGKVIISSIVIMLVLILSAGITFFEFARMSNTTSILISNNIQSINISRNLINLCDQYHSAVFQIISADNIKQNPALYSVEEVESDLIDLQSVISTEDEFAMADSVRYAYSAYMQVVHESDNKWYRTQDERLDWYFNNLQNIYEILRGYMQKLAGCSQIALTDNYDNLRDIYSRAIVPGLVAISAGILLMLLFNYFLNIFVIGPLLKMHKGIKDYRERNKSYNVVIEKGGDQLQEMNELVKDIIEENKSLRR